MYTLIAFATQWGSKLGGINNFNTDLLSAFGVAYHLRARILCITTSATDEEIKDALNTHVCLLPLPYPPEGGKLTQAQAQVAIDELKRLDIDFDPAKTVWLGHDLISGAAANEAAMIAGGRSALIHHMSYDHYESFAENSAAAYSKTQIQTTLFQQADLVLAVGPLLRDALNDKLAGSKKVSMLIPGMAEIDLRPAPKTFTAFLSGRLSENAARIKQGHLGIAAFAKAQREARKAGMPDGLRKQPKLILRGVDFDGQQAQSTPPDHVTPETELKRFAEEYADAVINLHALPYTLDRQTLYNDLSGASVALMPSWHEGFGLVAWEAIAAGVPLIVSKNSGVYHFLEEFFPGDGTGCVSPVDIQGAVDMPFFREEDLKAVTSELTAIANKPDEARRKAGRLRSILEDYTWPACAEQTANAFQWTLQKGSLPTEITARMATPPITPTPPTIAPSFAPTSLLQMPVKQWRAGSGIADSQLLRAEEAQVPFDPARQPELQDAYDWLDDPRWPQAVRLITGAGGLGKTRLALELCHQRLTEGWHAGFLDNDCNADDLTSGWQIWRDLNLPLLIVIDYAETRQPALLALVKAMLKNPGDQPVRVLLLARNGGEWWDNLPGQDPVCEALLSGYATSGPFCLPPLYLAAHDRSEAYRQALQAFAQTLDVPAPDVVPELSGEHFGRPLYLQMAALLALHGERPTTAEGLTKALLNHERRYWHGLLANSSLANPERRAQQLLALATLAGGFATLGHAKPYWMTACENTGTTEDLDTLFYALAPLYPGKQGLQTVRPDLLGEALVGQSLLKNGADGLLDAVLAHSADQPVRRHALTVLARLSSQRPDLHETLVVSLASHFIHCYHDILTVVTETTGPLPLLAEVAFNRLSPTAQSQLAGLLTPLLQEESVQLAGLACAVDRFIAEKARRKFLKKKKSTDCMSSYATAVGNYSIALQRAGRFEQSLACAQEAFRLYRQLYNKSRQRFSSSYAWALNIFANRLNDAGQYEEGLTHTRLALEIYQRLAQNNPGRYEPECAYSLGNFANLLNDAGQYEEGLAHSKQTLDTYQRLAQKNPDRYDPDYARSLINFSIHLSNTEQYQEGLTNSRQALVIYQRLAQEKPDRYEPVYAGSLRNFSSHLSDAGQYKEGLSNARQALEIYQRLAQKNPDRFEHDYARSLNTFASHLGDAGQYEKALIHARHALEIYRRLVQSNPDHFAPDYAGSLNSLAIRLSEAGHYSQAYSHADQAMFIYQRLATKYPARFEGVRFSCSCNKFYLHWLHTPSNKDRDFSKLIAIPATVPPLNRPRLQFYRDFVLACGSTEQTAYTYTFKEALTSWKALSMADQNNNKDYFLCAAAWCANFAPETINGIDWLATWELFNVQRQGCIPRWMQDTAKRLAFSWPQ